MDPVFEYMKMEQAQKIERGMLKAEYTIEGVHMYANGYRVVLENLKRYL